MASVICPQLDKSALEHFPTSDSKMTTEPPAVKAIWFDEHMLDWIHPALGPWIRAMAQLWITVWHLIFALFNSFKERQHVPAPEATDEAILMASAVRLARQIRRREISSTNVIETFIRRIDQINGDESDKMKVGLNAAVQKNFVEARKLASAVDKRLADLSEAERENLAESEPFLGVPFTVKDHIPIVGLLTTCGLKCFKTSPPPIEEDAEIVKRLRKAGGIPLAITNVPEALMWVESHNTIYGRTNNPYDYRCTAGGSSGGEAALVSAAGSVFGVGSDIGGSIRCPSLFNGTFGLKPSADLVTMKGCFPGELHGEQWQMVFANPDKLESLRLDEPVRLDKIRAMYFTGPDGFMQCPMSPAVFEGFLSALKAFQKVQTHAKSDKHEDLNANLLADNQSNGNSEYCNSVTAHSQGEFAPQHIRIPEADKATDFWIARFGSDEDALPIQYFYTAFQPPGLNGFSELVKFICGKSDHTLFGIVQCMSAQFLGLFKFNGEARQTLRKHVRQQILDLLGDDGVLFCPSLPLNSYFHHETIPLWADLSATAFWNAMSVPVVAIPVGRCPEGRPIGIQCVAAPHNERLLCAVAEALERELGGWREPWKCTETK